MKILISIIEEIFLFFNSILVRRTEEKEDKPCFPFNGFSNYKELKEKVVELSYHTGDVDTFKSLVNESIGGLLYVLEQSNKTVRVVFERDIEIYLTNHKLIF